MYFVTWGLSAAASWSILCRADLSPSMMAVCVDGSSNNMLSALRDIKATVSLVLQHNLNITCKPSVLNTVIQQQQ